MHRNKNELKQLTTENKTTAVNVRYVDREKELKSKNAFRKLKSIYEKEIFSDVQKQRHNKSRNYPYVSECSSYVVSSSVEEQKNPSPRVRKDPIITQKRNFSKICTFYRGDERNLRGLTLSIIGYRSINHLLEMINIKLSHGVKYIYPIPHGPSIKSLDQLEHNRSYVVCQDKIPGHKKFLKKDTVKSQTSKQFQCRIITICSSKNRSRKEMVILNPGTEMTFEEIIDDMSNRLQFNGTTLHMLRDPGEKVQNYQDLFSPKFSSTDDFLLCGPEVLPTADKLKTKTYKIRKHISSRPKKSYNLGNLNDK